MVRRELDATNSPGMAAAIVKGDDLKWVGAFGVARIDDDVPVTVDTLFMLASVSKVVTSTAAMQLVESGKLVLDSDVNSLVGFSVRNPTFSSRAVTTRMLLTHSAGIYDPDADLEKPGDSAISLERYVRGCILPDGEFASGWADEEPGQLYDYSNTGVALLGYVVEKAAGVPFERFTKTNLFEPLGMTESEWHLKGLDESHIAMPYTGSPGNYTEAGLYGYPDYPAGSLRTSVRQLARFLRMYLNDGELDGVRILKRETITEIERRQIPSIDREMAIMWRYQTIGGTTYLVKDGSDQGVSTLIGYDPKTRAGAIVLTNGSASQSETTGRALDALLARLIDRGSRM
jgi:CubicO group peptidase (beta-lactamase class C family)